MKYPCMYSVLYAAAWHPGRERDLQLQVLCEAVRYPLSLSQGGGVCVLSLRYVL